MTGQQRNEPWQYRPQPPKVNWYRVGAVVCWIVSAWYSIQTIQILGIMSSFWGVFVGSQGTALLMWAIAVAAASGYGGWWLWCKGNAPSPSSNNPGGSRRPRIPAGSSGPSEPKPYSTFPGWYPDPWGPPGQLRNWDGEHWTPYIFGGPQ